MAQWTTEFVGGEGDEWEVDVGVGGEVVVGEMGASGTKGGMIPSRDHVEDWGDCGESESPGD